jgi:hypothetical protein
MQAMCRFKGYMLYAVSTPTMLSELHLEEFTLFQGDWHISDGFLASFRNCIPPL